MLTSSIFVFENGNRRRQPRRQKAHFRISSKGIGQTRSRENNHDETCQYHSLEKSSAVHVPSSKGITLEFEAIPNQMLQEKSFITFRDTCDFHFEYLLNKKLPEEVGRCLGRLIYMSKLICMVLGASSNTESIKY